MTKHHLVTLTQAIKAEPGDMLHLTFARNGTATAYVIPKITADVIRGKQPQGSLNLTVAKPAESSKKVLGPVLRGQQSVAFEKLVFETINRLKTATMDDLVRELPQHRRAQINAKVYLLRNQGLIEGQQIDGKVFFATVAKSPRVARS